MGNKWTQEFSTVWMGKKGGCAISANTATRIADAHNADCDAYEARIAELETEVKQLNIDFDLAVRSRDWQQQAYVSTQAELARVKAESLRVVAHGAKMQLDELWCDEYLIACKGRVYIREYDTDNFVELSDGPCLDVHEDTIVQPVRLERWEEQG